MMTVASDAWTWVTSLQQKVRRLQPSHVERRVYAMVRDNAYDFTTGVLFPTTIDIYISRADAERWQRNPAVVRTLVAAIEQNLVQLHQGLRRPAVEAYVPRVTLAAEEGLAAGDFRVEVV